MHQHSHLRDSHQTHGSHTMSSIVRLKTHVTYRVAAFAHLGFRIDDVLLQREVIIS